MMENYIVRIYRRSENESEELVGLVEDVERGKTHPFKSAAELCRILTPSAENDYQKRRKRRSRAKQGVKKNSS